jgi:membrane associated rhomboid family serine protease
MLLIPTAVELPAGELPARSTPVVWVWLALVLALFVLERVVRIDHDLAFGWFSPQLFAGVTFTVASWSLYGDPALFDLWQLWSHLVVHPAWWLLALEIVLMLVIGRALERLLGTALFLAAIGCLAPLAGVLMVLAGPQPVFAGGLPLMVGLLGLAIGRLPGASVRWGVVWWAVVAVGHWPLFRMPLHTLFFLLMVLVVVTAPPAAVLPTLLATVAVAGTGFGLGVLIRRRVAPAAS